MRKKKFGTPKKTRVYNGKKKNGNGKKGGKYNEVGLVNFGSEMGRV